MSMHCYDNPYYYRLNPSLELLEEARAFFGEHRRIGAFVSLGNCLSPESVTPESPLLHDLPDSIVTKLRNEALAKETAHYKVQRDCEPGAYYRFDPAEFSVHYLQSVDLWQGVFAFEQVHRMEDIKILTELYLNQEVVGQQLKECANRLPMGKRSTGSLSMSFDSFTLSGSNTSASVPPSRADDSDFESLSISRTNTTGSTSL